MEQNGNRREIREFAAFAVILIAGLFLRFHALGAVRHNYDDAYPIYQAISLLNGTEPLLAGQPSSVFLDNPPLTKYLFSIPLLLWRSPWSVYIFTVGLNSLGTCFTYKLAKHILGTEVGLLSAFLFAINPWVIQFSRTTWVQALEPFLLPLIAWLFWPVLVGKANPFRMFAAIVSVTVLTQTYVQSWVVLFPITLLIMLFWPNIPRKMLYAGVLLFLAASFAYGIGLIQNLASNRAKLEKLFSESQLFFTRESMDHAVRLVTGRDFEYVYAKGTSDYSVRRLLSEAVHRMLAIALIVGVIRAIHALKNRKEGGPAIVLLIWFFLPTLLMSFAIAPVHPHYLLVTLPAGHILAAWGASLLLPRRELRWILLPLLLLTGGVFALNICRANEEVIHRPTAGADFNGWSLEAGARVGEVVRELCSDMGNVPCRVSAEGHPALLTSLSGLPVKVVPELDFPEYVMIPGNTPLLYILINVPSASFPIPFWRELPQHELLFADGTRVSFAHALPCTGEAAKALPGIVVNWPSETGLTLLGYTADPVAHPGQPFRLTTYWRVDALYPERVIRYVGAFYHFLSSEGNLVVNINGHGRWGYHWEVGDVYIETVEIPLPVDLLPGTYQVRFGLFDFVNPRNYDFYSPEWPTQVFTFTVLVE